MHRISRMNVIATSCGECLNSNVVYGQERISNQAHDDLYNIILYILKQETVIPAWNFRITRWY